MVEPAGETGHEQSRHRARHRLNQRGAEAHREVLMYLMPAVSDDPLPSPLSGTFAFAAARSRSPVRCVGPHDQHAGLSQDNGADGS